jgi:DNA processing protein
MTAPAPPPLDSETLSQWLRLAHTPGLGGRVRSELLDHFGSLETVFGATAAQLARATEGAASGLGALLEPLAPERLEAAAAWLAQPGRHLVTWLDADYPRLLREIADPPVLLYVHGNRSLLSSIQLAVVGSRNPTPAGRENAQAFARTLASGGLTITSGLALGIDGAAHRGALEAGGATIAVTGTGLDRVYPPRHRELAHDIAARGALVSEFPLGTPPRAENFPVRNRIISGLSLGVLVVEAAEKSGSLITARLSTEQGREVFAIPGSIHSPLARGCHKLIRQGAKLVETAQDVIEELGALATFAAPRLPANDIDAASTCAVELAESHSRILDCLGHDPATVDALVERSGLTAQAVSSILSELELRGLVAIQGGGRYVRMTG